MTCARFQIIEGDCLEILPTLGSVDHCITDPPYSEAVHRSVRSSGRKALPDIAEQACRTRRTVDLGFEHLTDEVRDRIAAWAGENVSRWSAFFSDSESSHLWRESCQGAGLDYVRTAAWIRRGGAPQFSGDRPAAGFEAITLMHPKGRKRWNGGGKAGIYDFPIVANRAGHRFDRVHPTQKPLALMMALIEDFTDPGDLVVDPFCGSGTTGVACIRLGRRFIGIERDPEHASTALARLTAEAAGLSLQAARSGQVGLFPVE